MLAAVVAAVVGAAAPVAERPGSGSLVGGALAGLVASPAAAAESDAGDAGDEGEDASRLAAVARHLRSDPVYVSPSLTRVASGDAVAALRRRVAGMPVPTFVAVLPRFDDEPGVDLLSDVLPVLRDRVGRPGLYVVADGSSYGLDVATFGVRTRGSARRATSVSSDGVPTSDGPLARLDVTLRHLATGYVPERSLAEEREARDRAPWIGFWIAAALGLVVPVGAVLGGPKARAGRRVRRAARARTGPQAASRVTAPTAEEARGEALDAIAGLARAIAEDPAPADRATRAYEAASHVLADRRPAVVDLVGAATLARAGTAWLGTPSWRPCFFDPRHGAGDRQTRWRRGADEIQVPTCAACAQALGDDTEPAVLGDRGRPYFERDTVWARTGFGALDDDIAEIILAGGRRPS